MTQFQFDSILKIIELGAPVLYQDLGNALNDLVVERNKFEQENRDLKARLETVKGYEMEEEPVSSESLER